ncbi:MAG: LysR family transcriptional regulator [Candidatus Margulisiibacteriota bacterium]
MIEKHHLEIVKAVQDTGTVTAAAKLLNLTQSALSHTIKKLETQLKTPLWTKQGRSLILTPAGLDVLEAANRLLPQFEHLQSQLALYPHGKRGRLRMGMECHPCRQWLTGILKTYMHRFADIELDITEQFQFNGQAALLNNDIDVLITPDPIPHPGLRFEPVFAYRFDGVVAAHHRLAGTPFLTPQDLVEETIFTYPVPIERLDIFTQFFSPAQCFPKRHKAMESTDLMVQLVAAGRGVSALPHWLIEHYQKQFAIVGLPLGKQGIHKHIHVGIRHQALLTPYIQGFLDCARTTTSPGEPSALTAPAPPNTEQAAAHTPTAPSPS